MKNIKLVYVNGDYTYTRINGTEKEIIDFLSGSSHHILILSMSFCFHQISSPQVLSASRFAALRCLSSFNALAYMTGSL